MLPRIRCTNEFAVVVSGQRRVRVTATQAHDCELFTIYERRVGAFLSSGEEAMGWTVVISLGRDKYRFINDVPMLLFIVRAIYWIV